MNIREVGCVLLFTIVENGFHLQANILTIFDSIIKRIITYTKK